MSGRPLVFGEVLFDRFPDGSEVLGGAPFNVAWHLQGFGLAPLFVSRVGDDGAGRGIVAAMRAWGMDTLAVEIDPERATGSVEIDLVAGEPRYSIDPNQAYGHIEAGGAATLIQPALVYHGSLALWREDSRRTLDALTARLGVPIFLDVNLRAPWWQADAVAAAMARATWVKLNQDELVHLAGPGDTVERAAGLCGQCALKRVIVTLGAEGALVVDGAGGQESVRPVMVGDVVDTVGAGDAFSAVFMLGLLRGWDMSTTLARAQGFASAIVAVRGATVADPDFYRHFLDSWSGA